LSYFVTTDEDYCEPRATRVDPSCCGGTLSGLIAQLGSVPGGPTFKRDPATSAQNEDDLLVSDLIVVTDGEIDYSFTI